MQLKQTQAALISFKNFVIQQSRSRLTKGDKNYTKSLYDSLDANLKVMPNSIKLEFEMEEYGMYQDKGVSGVEKKYNTPYSYTNKMPPVKPLADWAKFRNIRLRDEKGRFAKGNYLTIGLLIALKIYKNGIKPSLFFTKPFEKYFKNIPQEITDAFGLDVSNFMSFLIKQNFRTND